MPEPAFLVDGLMEKKIVQRLCPGKVVRQIGCNGRDVSMPTLARFIITHMQDLVNRFYPIVIVFDREDRPTSSEGLIAELGRILDQDGYAGQYVIGVPDRTTESWFLADWHSVASTFGYEVRPNRMSEGEFGKRLVKQLLPDGVIYNEAALGFRFFVACDPAKMYESSASFRSLVDRFPFKCPWLGN